MIFRGHVHNGVVVPDQATELPEGAAVRFELTSPRDSAGTAPSNRRQGGQWKGQVVISGDFDELPGDLAEALGLRMPCLSLI
jgi:hypothetical protein